MILSVLKELNDQRVALTPEGARKAAGLGLQVLVERGAGHGAFFPDAEYEPHARLVSRQEALEQADMLLSIHPLPLAEWGRLKAGGTFIAEWQPFNDPGVVEQLREHRRDALSLDMIPRTTLAQAMDVLSSMAAIAGYAAVLEAARHLPRYFPMMITAAGSIRPAKVLVLGAGVAGLQAIATARRLGASVEAFDTRSAAREEVLSLGAKFVDVPGAVEDKGAGGYGVQQSEEFLARQRAEVQSRAAKSDVIITTAQVRGRRAPLLVPAATVELMQPGSVIVDLASSSGGNCELTQDGQVIQHHGVTIIGNSHLAAQKPQDASSMYSNNVLNFLKLIAPKGDLLLDADNEIIRGAWITAPATVS